MLKYLKRYVERYLVQLKHFKNVLTIKAGFVFRCLGSNFIT